MSKIEIKILESISFGALLMFASVQAWGGIGAHGGLAVSCPSQPTVMLDYYNASLPTLNGGSRQLVDIASMTEAQVENLIRSRIAGTSFEVKYPRISEKLGSFNDWIATDLRGIDDSAEPYSLPQACTKVVVAARQDDAMYIDPTAYSQLSAGQTGLLRAHEILYAIDGRDTSKYVRMFMREALLARPNPQKLAAAALGLGAVPVNMSKMFEGEFVYEGVSEERYHLYCQMMMRNGPTAGKNQLWMGMYDGCPAIDWTKLSCDLKTFKCKSANGGIKLTALDYNTLSLEEASRPDRNLTYTRK